ncbi:2OG-Fe(II) oxygenase [uncultured Thiohalocapsa sp.]|uniref:2OG-Fe(II) oxygenase n=1 Tax=uncultured Thiohalocapsa sp. TaxID=768990 RepID=UPI0025CDDFBF|nr:2OG-Fe(II) oxygenase [uncultured Thiohalocapsa sp.]
MSHLQQALADILTRVHRPGDFYAAGTMDLHLPQLRVDGVGPIALPLLPMQAEQLIAVAEQAPYGRGTETLVDTEVRRTWQIDARRLDLGGRRWGEDLARTVRAVAAALGVRGEVRAEIYKLLVYDAGGFFVSHRDSEKAPGMFATLVVTLPSEYTGGELIIRHKGHEVALDLHTGDPGQAAYAAFYADCRHEVRPVASGHRLALIYNLVRPNGEPLPQPPDYDQERAQLAALLRRWPQADPAAEQPHKLIYPLEHSYTEAELGFAGLKGVDAAVAAVMLGAAEDADCDLQLAMVTIGESGWAEYTGGGYWRDDDAFEIGEVLDTWQELHTWRLPDDAALDMAPLPFEDGEVCPPNAFADKDDVEPDFEEATGNEGASFERTYQRAALVLWPGHGRARVLADGGPTASLPYLERLLTQLRADEAAGASADRIAALRQQALALATCIREAWTASAFAGQELSKRGLAAQLLDALRQLDDTDGGAAFIEDVCAAGGYTGEDNMAIARLCAALPAARAARLLHTIIDGNALRDPAACAQLLARCTEQWPESTIALLHPAALALLAGLPDPDKRPEPAPGGFHPPAPRPTPELVLGALVGLSRLDTALAERALHHCLDHPRLYDPDAILLPAALAVAAAHDPADIAHLPPALTGLRNAVLRHLDARIQAPLTPPPDWQRVADIRCDCADCSALKRFLASPTEATWQLKAAESRRRHLEHSIQAHRCDLHTRTDKSGRPYSLVCIKNQASYDRRVQQRKQDLHNRARLTGGQPA